MNRWLRLWAAAATVLTLAACGPKGEKAAYTVKGDNVFRYALQSRPTSLDPATVEDGDTIDMLMQVFEGLVQWSESNEIVPNIAERWEISGDGRVYTFHLKSNVLFHKPFERKLTAQDFVYSITRALLPATKSATAMNYLNDIVGAADVADGKTSTLAGVKALSDTTLEITIDKRKPYFLGKLTYPTAYAVCREAIEKNGGRVDEKSMIGTGPFALAQYKPGYSVLLAANPAYHGGKPILDGIERPILPDSNTRQTRYESGGTDITDIQRADLSRIQADPVLGKQLREFPRANIWYLALNQLAFEPFKDKRVRQAFAHAIDKDAVIKLALKGTAARAEGIVPPGVLGHQAGFRGLAYDPERARKLLADAGYPGGKGFPKLTISFRQGYKYIEDAVIAVRSDLKRNLGIECDIQQIEWAQFLKQRTDGTLPCYHLRWAADYLDPQNFLSLMLHTGSPENTIGYANPEFDRLCDMADVEPDPEKRLKLYAQAERIAVDDAPWVPMYHLRDVELHKPHLKGLRDSLMGHLPHITTSVKP
ncbi:MAG: peptide ABC transporter substrate-binding protein [Chthonomonadales bacterium]|nr:peptide ABC transporter substrate-binding protein [Chthonomonadales bacterium]